MRYAFYCFTCFVVAFASIFFFITDQVIRMLITFVLGIR